MKYITNGLSILILSLAAVQVHAVEIQECIDENNESTFQDKCPPGTRSVKSIKLKTGESSTPVIIGPEISLYAAPNCEACDITRNVLNNHGATFKEVNIKDNVNAQNKLRVLLGSKGKLSIPTVIIDDKQIVGFNEKRLTSELEAAGYKDRSKPAAAETEEDEDQADTETEAETAEEQTDTVTEAETAEEQADTE